MESPKREIMPGAAFMELSSAARKRLVASFPQAAERLYRDNRLDANKNMTNMVRA